MPVMQSDKVLVLAEGFMERSFVNANFRNFLLIPLLNGKSWTSERMCEQIGTKFFAKNILPKAIIVWIDQESHVCDRSRFRQMIVDELVARGAVASSIHVCMPNKMTENIILSDEIVIRSVFEENEYNYEYEGKNGKHILANMYKNKGKNYKETFHGVELLKKVRLGRAARKSQSAAEFLQTMDDPCWWVDAES